MNRIVEMKIDVQYEKEVYIKVGGYEWSIFCKYKQKAQKMQYFFGSTLSNSRYVSS